MTTSSFLVVSPLRGSLVKNFLERARESAEKAARPAKVCLPDSSEPLVELVPQFQMEPELACYVQMTVAVVGDIHEHLHSDMYSRLTTINHYVDAEGNDVLYGIIAYNERFRAVAQALYHNMPANTEWAAPKRHEGYMPNIPICKGKGIAAILRGTSLQESLMSTHFVIDEPVAKPELYVRTPSGTWRPFTEGAEWKKFHKGDGVRAKPTFTGHKARSNREPA